MTLQFHALAGVNVALHNSVYDGGGYEDVRLDFRGFAYDQRARQRTQLAGDIAIDAQRAFKSKFARPWSFGNGELSRLKILVGLQCGFELGEPGCKCTGKRICEFTGGGTLVQRRALRCRIWYWSLGIRHGATLVRSGEVYLSPFSFLSIRQSPWKTAPGFMVRVRVEMLPLITAAGPSSTRSWPMTSPLTVPLITTAPTSMSPSTSADRSTISVPVGDVTLPATWPLIRSMSLKLISPVSSGSD